MMMLDSQDIQTYTLRNGIRLVHRRDASAVVYCGLAINVGTRDEREDESGMAHFIEHTMFKGTEKRKAWHILNRLESVGGELNAYTTKEETYVYAAVQREYFERAMEICADVVFHSVFPQAEIEKEVEVIVDEIQSYRDTPSELIFDEFEAMLFEGSALGRDILGDPKRLRRYKTADALRFVAENYCTDRMIFFSVGNVEFKKVCRWAEKYLADVPEKCGAEGRIAPLAYEPKQRTVRKKTYQSHVIVGNRAYDLKSDKRLTLCLLNNILGGPCMNSRLNVALRERNGMAYNVESVYTSYSDTGLVSVYFGTDEKNRERCMSLVYAELEELKNTKMTPLQMERAKKQLLGQLVIAQENRESLSLALAKCHLFFNKFESIDEVARSLQGIQAEHLLEVANEVFDVDALSMLSYVR